MPYDIPSGITSEVKHFPGEIVAAVDMPGNIFSSTGHQIMEMGIVFSILLVVIIVQAVVNRQQYKDSRADREDLLAAFKDNAAALNNLAKQQEIANAQKNQPCLYGKT